VPSFKERECPACNKVSNFRTDAKTCGCAGKHPQLNQIVAKDRVAVELEKLRDKRLGKDEEIKALQEYIIRLEDEKDVLTKFEAHTPQIIDIPPKASSSKSESVATVVWSDHHCEEEILEEAVGGQNEYNLKIYDKRFINLVHGTISWFEIESVKTVIKTLVIALLGDFISGSIHEDLAESNLLLPVDAIYTAQEHLISGIKFILDNTPKDLEILIVCHSGNHGRMTKKQRISTEAGNSLEQYMYYTIRDYFKKEKRLKFLIGTGYHSYVQFFGGNYVVRFHHGHQINYQGGVGGLTIPVNKAIAQWNKARVVDLDVFGHFHTKFDGGNFIANGSLIGYSPYAVSIKASYEKPSQTFFLINREYNEKTVVAPIYV
jgi:hypothetical protein